MRLCESLLNQKTEQRLETILSYFGRTTSSRIRVVLFQLLLLQSELNIQKYPFLFIHLEQGILESCSCDENMSTYSKFLLQNNNNNNNNNIRSSSPKQEILDLLIRAILESENETTTRISMNTLCSFYPSEYVIKSLLEHERRTVLSHCLISCVNNDVKTTTTLRVIRNLVVKCSNYFYRTDLNVLVDILLRQIHDLDPDLKLRSEMFRTLLCVLSKSNWADTGTYRMEDIVSTMEVLQDKYADAKKCLRLLRTWL